MSYRYKKGSRKAQGAKPFHINSSDTPYQPYKTCSGCGKDMWLRKSASGLQYGSGRNRKMYSVYYACPNCGKVIGLEEK